MPMLRKVCINAVILCTALLPLSAYAEEKPSSGKSVNIELKLGEDKININDQSIAVEKPYVTSGTTLVPLRVITTAFGAALSWDSETQTVGLKSGSTTISLKIGSKTAMVNGKPEELEAAAELTNGTTMVPIRFIAEKFGAKVTFDESTSSVKISGTQTASSSDSAGIDSDVGKTQIGNSFYGWSMKYPSGLIKDYQNYSEDYVSFEDANGEFSMSVSVESDMAENLSRDALINLLADEVEEKILEKTFVADGSRSYARKITKDEDTIYEYRAYQNEDKVYFISFTIHKEENYKNPVKYSAYKDLMDSFKTTYPSNDKTAKDLSMVKDGLRSFTDETYGFSLRLPADWKKRNAKGEVITFADPKGTNSIGIQITSKKEGETLRTWTDRNSKIFMDLWVPEYRKVEPERAITIDGVQAIAKRSHNTFDTKTWDATENVYVIKGDYKYYIYFQFDKQDALSENLIETTLQSIKLGKPSGSLGTIKDSGEDYDRTAKSTVKNKTYNYTITIPNYWKAESAKSSPDFLQYTYEFGGFFVGVEESVELTPSQIVSKMKEGLQSRSKSAQLKEIENRTETIDGVRAEWAVWETQDAVTTVCSFQKNGMTFLASATHAKAVNTEFMKNLIASTIKSIQVGK